MAQVTGTGYIWNLPNYFGELFTADEEATPFLSYIGGLNGGMQTDNFEFETGSLYDYPDPIQPEITEAASTTAPTATQGVRSQTSNVVQIFQQAVDISYVKLANSGRLSGLNTGATVNNLEDEKDWQIQYNLTIIARNVEYSFIYGSYQVSTGETVANKTRGMLELCDDATSTDIDAGAATLTKAMMDSLFLGMREAGAKMTDPVIWASPKNKAAITELYVLDENLSRTRTIGGKDVQVIITDFGNVTVAPMGHRFMTNTDILLADMAYINPVTQPVPEKGNMFYEPLAKVGAAENGQLFGQIGLDHGPAFLHGKISNLPA